MKNLFKLMFSVLMFSIVIQNVEAESLESDMNAISASKLQEDKQALQTLKEIIENSPEAFKAYQNEIGAIMKAMADADLANDEQKLNQLKSQAQAAQIKFQALTEKIDGEIVTAGLTTVGSWALAISAWGWSVKHPNLPLNKTKANLVFGTWLTALVGGVVSGSVHGAKYFGLVVGLPDASDNSKNADNQRQEISRINELISKMENQISEKKKELQTQERAKSSIETLIPQADH